MSITIPLRISTNSFSSSNNNSLIKIQRGEENEKRSAILKKNSARSSYDSITFSPTGSQKDILQPNLKDIFARSRATRTAITPNIKHRSHIIFERNVDRSKQNSVHYLSPHKKSTSQFDNLRERILGGRPIVRQMSGGFSRMDSFRSISGSSDRHNSICSNGDKIIFQRPVIAKSLPRSPHTASTGEGDAERLIGSTPENFQEENTKQLIKKLMDTISRKKGEAESEGRKNDSVALPARHPWRYLVWNPYVNDDQFKRHLYVVYRGIKYSMKALKGPSEDFLKSKLVEIPDDPKKRRQKTLVLDLDETLLHSTNPSQPCDVVLTTHRPDGTEQKIYLQLRPHLHEFLKKMSFWFELVIFTASPPWYAHAILNFLDPLRTLFAHILTRPNCMETKNGYFIKDLRVLKNRDLKNVVIVDNLSHSFGLQIDNGIPILKFVGSKEDRELRYLMEYLRELEKAPDVRVFNQSRLKLKTMIDWKENDLFGISNK